VLAGYAFAKPAPQPRKKVPLLREIGQLGSSYMIPIVKWFTDSSRSVWLCQADGRPSMGAALLRAVRFRFRRIVMRGFNRTATMVWLSLILESTLSG
jgi:hypothetical protein